MDLPLHRVRVVDFTQVMMGPCATQVLGDFGAEVIKVERPGVGDLSRRSIVDSDQGDNPVYCSLNRNKRSIAIDLRSIEGKQIVYELIKTADVVVSNFRAGVMDRLGFGYQELREKNPKLIYAIGTGFGSFGPYQEKGGQDALAQAYTGVMLRRADPSLPLAVYATTFADYSTGMLLVQGILLALLAREQTGTGQMVEVSLYDTLLALQMQEATVQRMRGEELNWGAMPLTGVFETSDGAIVLVGAFKDNALHNISVALELDEDLSERQEFVSFDAQMVHRVELHAILRERFATNTSAYWLARLEGQDLLCGPVRSLAEALDDEQTHCNGMLLDYKHPVAGLVRTVGSPVHLSDTPAQLRRPAPTLGQDTEGVLTEVGFKPAELQALKLAGVIA